MLTSSNYLCVSSVTLYDVRSDVDVLYVCRIVEHNIGKICIQRVVVIRFKKTVVKHLYMVMNRVPMFT